MFCFAADARYEIKDSPVPCRDCGDVRARDAELQTNEKHFSKRFGRIVQQSEEIAMTLFEFPGPERRRSVRTQLVVPIHVHGQTRTGEKFTVKVETHTVSNSGCLIHVDTVLFVDQTLEVTNRKTGQSIRGKVVSTWRQPGGRIFAGLEFSPLSEDFWRSEIPSSIGPPRNTP